jgi:hypothetical protein
MEQFGVMAAKLAEARQTHQSTPNEIILAYGLSARLTDDTKPTRGGGEPPPRCCGLAPIRQAGCECMVHEYSS